MLNDISFQRGMFHYAEFQPEHNHAPHFLESCFLCRKPLGRNADIFMYRGNTPFCSTECREEQIEIDDSKDRNWKKMHASARSSNKPVTGQANQQVWLDRFRSKLLDQNGLCNYMMVGNGEGAR